MSDFFYDLKYMLSADNTTSRGFYWTITIVSVLLYLADIIGVVLLIAGVINANKAIVAIAIAVTFVLVTVLWIWLAKRN